jgi:hypothetical protein
MEEQNSEQLQAQFQPAAAPPQRMAVTLDMDADVMDWLKEQHLDWQQELNNLARFFMETSQSRETAFEEAAAPAEHELDTSGPDPARNASKIDNEFIPT